MTDEQHDERERACIREFDGGMTREEADKAAREEYRDQNTAEDRW